MPGGEHKLEEAQAILAALTVMAGERKGARHSPLRIAEPEEARASL